VIVGAVGSLVAAAPLDPSPGEARSWLRHELLHPEYHQQNLVEQVVGWLERQVGRGLDAAAGAPPLSTFAGMVVFLLLAATLVLLASRARRSARATTETRSVLTGEVVTSAALRARAETALADGRHGEALLDGFRALTVRQVECGRLDDAPGATAHEVADALGAAYPHQRTQVDRGARLFDSVLYGHRAATRDQAGSVLALDDELAGRR
jgi:Domain of unknown function (DUF4129)